MSLARAVRSVCRPLRHAISSLQALGRVTAGALVLISVQPAALADDSEPAASVIARLRINEAPAPVHERAQWHEPRKVLLLQFGRPEWPIGQDVLAAAAPGAQFVVAKDMASAIKAAAGADVIVGFNPEICDARILDSAKDLRWISSLAAGVELCMAVPTVRSRNLLVTNMRGVDAPVIAEHAIALALALAHGLDTFVLDTAQGVWSREHAATAHVETLEGKTLLVVGLGGIGTEVAMRAHGLGMKVVATRESDRAKPDFVSYVGLSDEMLTLAKTADVIVNSVPLTPQTQGMYGAKFFSVLKPTALFINIARGGVVATPELVKALQERRLAGAGLDVTDPEPLPADHPLWHAPHVIITPHMSSRSDLPGQARWELLRENLRRYAAGEKMLSVVDLTKGY